MVLEAVRRAHGELAAAVAAPVWSLADAELVASVEAAFGLVERARVLLAHLVAEADGRGVPKAEGASSVPVWLRLRLRVGIHEGKRLADLAGVLHARPGLDAAVCAGAVTGEQARVIGAALDALPDGCGPEVVAEAERTLVGFAERFEPAVLRRFGERILSHVDPVAADKVEEAALRRAEARSHKTRGLSLTDVGDGRVRVTGWLDGEAAAIVAAALDPLCRPIPGDPRTPAQRRADALTDVCRLALSTGELPVNGGDRPQVVVTLPFDALAGRVGAATLDSGVRLTAEQARRIACDAQIIPAVLGGDGQVLDVGQSRRLFTGAIRRALVLRDGGCAFPGCDRPARWCEQRPPHPIMGRWRVDQP